MAVDPKLLTRSSWHTWSLSVSTWSVSQSSRVSTCISVHRNSSSTVLGGARLPGTSGKLHFCARCCLSSARCRLASAPSAPASSSLSPSPCARTASPSSRCCWTWSFSMYRTTFRRRPRKKSPCTKPLRSSRTLAVFLTKESAAAGTPAPASAAAAAAAFSAHSSLGGSSSSRSTSQSPMRSSSQSTSMAASRGGGSSAGPPSAGASPETSALYRRQSSFCGRKMRSLA
mmetsp:Transcript_78271/g.221294  ORF Transcript_78271/g.221294 Transcript_78271/m.221294 type:complete len:229 (+) Transcript_78271:549-1235(+)